LFPDRSWLAPFMAHRMRPVALRPCAGMVDRMCHWYGTYSLW
jgi:hypothetical protein